METQTNETVNEEISQNLLQENECLLAGCQLSFSNGWLVPIAGSMGR